MTVNFDFVSLSCKCQNDRPTVTFLYKIMRENNSISYTLFI